MVIRKYQYTGTQLTEVLFDNTGSAVFDEIVGIKIPTNVMNIDNAVIKTTILNAPIVMELKETNNYKDTANWGVIYLTNMGVYDTNTQTLYIALIPNSSFEPVSVKIELLPNPSAPNYITIATGTFNKLGTSPIITGDDAKMFGTGNKINATNLAFKLSGNDFKKKSIIVGTGCVDTSLLTKYSDNDFVKLGDIRYKASALNLIYSISNKSQVANTYSIDNLETPLNISKPFKIEAYVQYPSNIDVSTYNGVWRSIALYTPQINDSSHSGYIQLRLHNNTNVGSASKCAYFGFNSLSPTPENKISTILTIAQSPTGLYYCAESTDGKNIKITIDNKVMNYSTYDNTMVFNKILFGKPNSITYENVGGTIIIKSLKIYN